MIGRDRAGLVYGVGGDQSVVDGLYLLHSQRDQTTAFESAILSVSEPDWRARGPSGSGQPRPPAPRPVGALVEAQRPVVSQEIAWVSSMQRLYVTCARV